MKRRFLVRVVVATAATGAFMSGLSPAYASVFRNQFDMTLGDLQGPAYSDTDVKALSGNDGRVHTASIGSTYKVDALMCSGVYACGRGTKVFGLDDGSRVALKNSYDAGTNARLELRVASLNAVQVQVQGDWFSG